MVGLSVLLLYLGEVLLTKRAAEKKELYHNRVSLVNTYDFGELYFKSP